MYKICFKSIFSYVLLYYFILLFKKRTISQIITLFYLYLKLFFSVQQQFYYNIATQQFIDGLSRDAFINFIFYHITMLVNTDINHKKRIALPLVFLFLLAWCGIVEFVWVSLIWPRRSITNDPITLSVLTSICLAGIGPRNTLQLLINHLFQNVKLNINMQFAYSFKYE